MAGSSHSAESNIDNSLQRGRACAYCRRRKMRCDGVRPVCGQCFRTSRADECKYTDSQSRSKEEEDISQIESRIYELEHPEKAAEGSVLLHHPYHPPQNPPNLFQLSDSSVGSGPPRPAQSTADTWGNGPEPPMDLVETLLDAFLPYAHDWGFFLDISDFRRDTLLRLPMGHHSRPSPPLLTGVYLIGITLSHSPTMKTHEKAFLSRTLSALPVSLSGIHPRKVTHALQTEILLSNYFYAHGRLLEGRYHTAAAVSLMVSSVLPKINREQLPFQSLTEGEIDGFWTTIILDKSWAVVLATQPNLQHQCDEMFNTNSSLIDDTETSTDVPLLATATMLWERANSLMAGWDAGMTPQESYNFYSAFNTLDTRIQHFNTTISPRGGSQDVPDDRQLFVGRSIAHAAVIQLHETFCQTNPESKQRCSAAAKSILNLLASSGMHNFAFINPVISTIWVTASEILVDEIASLRTVRPAWAHEVPTSAETSLVSLLNRGVEVMRRFASWPLIRFQLVKIEQTYSSL
ncbi:hypothetical protein B0H11DRAFT_1953063 [Mycena galericulata]|nr:hypothetical protein B0H11DRAFT_1953063 [Mycena galericulata]